MNDTEMNIRKNIESMIEADRIMMLAIDRVQKALDSGLLTLGDQKTETLDDNTMYSKEDIIEGTYKDIGFRMRLLHYNMLTKMFVPVKCRTLSNKVVAGHWCAYLTLSKAQADIFGDEDGMIQPYGGVNFGDVDEEGHSIIGWDFGHDFEDGVTPFQVLEDIIRCVDELKGREI